MSGRFLNIHIQNSGYGVVLNPVMGKSETREVIAIFDTFEEARDFYLSQRVEPYTENGPDHYNGGTKPYRLSFKDGPLKWFNPADDETILTFNPEGEEGIIRVWRRNHTFERFELEKLKGQPDAVIVQRIRDALGL